MRTASVFVAIKACDRQNCAVKAAIERRVDRLLKLVHQKMCQAGFRPSSGVSLLKLHLNVEGLGGQTPILRLKSFAAEKV